jgi:hypothetical protein
MGLSDLWFFSKVLDKQVKIIMAVIDDENKLNFFTLLSDL